MKRTKDIALDEMQRNNDKLEELNKIYHETLIEFEELFEDDSRG
jgi:hypothetical protein